MMGLHTSSGDKFKEQLHTWDKIHTSHCVQLKLMWDFNHLKLIFTLRNFLQMWPMKCLCSLCLFAPNSQYTDCINVSCKLDSNVRTTMCVRCVSVLCLCGGSVTESLQSSLGTPILSVFSLHSQFSHSVWTYMKYSSCQKYGHTFSFKLTTIY